VIKFNFFTFADLRFEVVVDVDFIGCGGLSLGGFAVPAVCVCFRAFHRPRAASSFGSSFV
jgi:hypothetical protein